MERFLLRHSIENIERIKSLFESEIKNIERKANKGMKENYLGYSIVTYVRTVSLKDTSLIDKDSYNSFEKFMKKYVEIIPDDTPNKPISYTLKNLDKLNIDEDEFDPQKQSVDFEKFASMPRLFCDETIIMLMVKFEEIISNLLICLFQRFPDKYLSDKTIPYSEIIKLNGIEVEKYVIDKLIEETMRKDYSQWFEIFKSHGMNIEKYGVLDDFIELYFRRNLVVHNRSMVNDAYLSGIKKTKIIKPEKDAVLQVDKQYVLKAFDTIECLLFAVFLECSKFYKGEEKDSYLNEIFYVAFEFLDTERYKVSQFVFSQLENSSLDNNTKTMSKVNRWISTKNIDGLKAIEEEVRNTDFTAMKDDFIIAKELLLENYDSAMPLLETMINNDGMTIAIEKWPLFKDFRKTNYYSELKEKYKTKFENRKFENDKPDNSGEMVSFSEIKENVENMTK